MGERALAADWHFGDILDGVARVVPGDRPAVIRGDHVLTWQEFDRRTNRLARAMQAAGLRPGDRVAILARNITEFIEVVGATFKARLAWANLNYRYTATEVAYVLADCGARAIFYQDEFAGIATAALASLPPMAMAVSIGPSGTYEEILSQGDDGPLDIARSPADSYLLYTGGTTGKPKGVVWRMSDARLVQLESPTLKAAPPATLDAHLAAVAANAKPGRVLPACPLMHGVGTNSSFAELMNGGTVVLLPGATFSAEELWSSVESAGVTRILIVGDVFGRPMVDALRAYPDRWNLSSLALISSSGLMWSREVKAGLIEQLPGITLLDIIGASEASNFAYAFTTAAKTMPTGLFEAAPRTVLVAPDYGRILAPDEPGPGLLARRPPFAMGYFGDPAKSAATYREIDGELLAIPGDMAERTPEGLLRLIGRDSMVINTGGEKVFVEEVEEALKRAPGVVDAMVVGVPDAKWGKSVAALVVAAPDYDEAAVRAALSQDLAPYKMPRRIVRQDAVPRHASGKGDYRRAATIAAGPPDTEAAA